MEVPGKKLQLETSAVDTTYCQPCSQDGETLPAEAYCTVCTEFFCSICASLHKKQKMTRSHALLDKSNMPTSMSGQDDDDEYIEPCEIHPKEFIKYFCPTHQTLNCGHCIVQHHRSCRVDVISDISHAFKNGPEYGNIDNATAKLFKDIDECASEVENNVKLIAELGESVVYELRRCRDKVNNYFDEREKSLLKIIEQMKDIDEALLDNLRPKCNNLKAKVEEIKNNLKTHENNTIQLFIEAKRAEQILEVTGTALADINKQNTIHQYKFRKDLATERLMTSSTGLGIVEEEVVDIQNNPVKSAGKTMATGQSANIHAETDELLSDYTEETQITSYVDLKRLKFIPAVSIPVKSTIDIKDCWLTSMLLLPMNRLLLADFRNSTVKLVDQQTSSRVSQVSVPGPPWGMCLLPGDKVAITMTTKGIQLLKTQGQLALSDYIKVHGDCRGIGYHDKLLIVSYYSGQIEILDMKGDVIRQYSWGQVFGYSPHLTVVSEDPTTFIFVSHHINNTITMLDMDLNILRTFSDSALKRPRGLSMFANQLIFCGDKSNNIMRMDLSSGKVSQLLGEDDGIQEPEYCVYSPHQKKLYVTCYNLQHDYENNSIKVYNAIQ